MRISHHTLLWHTTPCASWNTHTHTHTHMHTFYHATVRIALYHIPHHAIHTNTHASCKHWHNYIWQMWLCVHVCNPNMHNPCLPVCTLASTSTRYACIPETNWILISSACLPSEWVNCNNNSSSTASVVCKQVYVYIYIYIYIYIYG